MTQSLQLKLQSKRQKTPHSRQPEVFKAASTDGSAGRRHRYSILVESQVRQTVGWFWNVACALGERFGGSWKTRLPRLRVAKFGYFCCFFQTSWAIKIRSRSKPVPESDKPKRLRGRSLPRAPSTWCQALRVLPGQWLARIGALGAGGDE